MKKEPNASLETRMGRIDGRLIKMEESFSKLVSALKEESKIRRKNAIIMNNNFQVLNNKIESLHRNTDRNFEEVKAELIKTQKATGYDDLLKNLEGLN